MLGHSKGYWNYSILGHSWPTFSLFLPLQPSLYTLPWAEFFYFIQCPKRQGGCQTFESGCRITMNSWKKVWKLTQRKNDHTCAVSACRPSTVRAGKVKFTRWFTAVESLSWSNSSFVTNRSENNRVKVYNDVKFVINKSLWEAFCQIKSKMQTWKVFLPSCSREI